MAYHRGGRVVSGATASVGACGSPGVLAASLNNSANTFSASDTVYSDGHHGYGDGLGGEGTESWVVPQTTPVAANYEVFVHVTSGSFTSGALDTWLACTSNRAWTKGAAGTVNYQMSFRQKNGPTLKTYTLSMVVT